MKSDVKDERLESSSSSESGSEDDEEAWKLTDEVEKEFFKTLSQIKSKDPNIYKNDVEFFKDIPDSEHKPKKKTAPFTVLDYERKMLVEKGGKIDDEDEDAPVQSIARISYAEEQNALKNSMKNLLQSDSEYESEAELGGLFKKRDKSHTETEKEENDYKEWLKGQKNEAPDQEVAKEMKPLRDFWTNPDLKEDDQFLRDYILNKRFLEEKDNEDSKLDIKTEPINDEASDGDFTHRTEEPDREYIKRYPRINGNTVRRKDDSRKRKREEIKERKQKEKQKKKAEVRLKQKLKRKEIEQKLEELKQLTGNDSLAFDNILENDFDIEEHSKAMERLFSEEFYSKDDPSFIPLNQEDGEGDWDDVEEEIEDGGDESLIKEEDIKKEMEDDAENYEPTCEDPDFNMDCDYDPTVERAIPLSSRSRRRKEKLRANLCSTDDFLTFNRAVKKEKPVFDPTVHSSLQEYLDQYYAIECEDFIGDLPCRFKYKKTTPNSYGLTIDEILRADPKELNRWYSMKRLTQLKPLHKEKSEVMSYYKRAKNEALKRKILPSLYKNAEGEDENKTHNESKLTVIKKEDEPSNSGTSDLNKKRKSVASEMIVPPNKRRKTTPEQKKTHKFNKNKNQEMIVPPNKRRNTTSEEGKPHKFNKNKNQKRQKEVSPNKRRNTTTEEGKPHKFNKNKNQKRQKENLKNDKNKSDNQNISNEKNGLLSISDARLQAYGIKPKKFRNKLKYSGMEGDKTNRLNKGDRNKQEKKKASGNDKPSKFTSKKSKQKKNSSEWVVSKT